MIHYNIINGKIGVGVRKGCYSVINLDKNRRTAAEWMRQFSFEVKSFSQICF